VRTLAAQLWSRRPTPLHSDWLLAGILLIAGELQIWVGHIAGRHRLEAALVAAALSAAVAVRRLYPTTAGVGAGCLASLTIMVWGDPQVISSGIATLCALYAFAVWTPLRSFLAGATVLTVVGLAPGPRWDNRSVWIVAALVVIVIVRRGIRDRERRAELAERERDLAAREAVAEERARIARELHDVVAHGVSVMVIQAQAGPRLLADEEQVRGAFRSIETTGREALVELRRLLGVLRGGDEHAATAPQPGLGALDALLEQVRDAGLRVDLRVEGEPVQLPVGVDLSAYRIVQEGLTNTLKHAGRAEAEVIVRYHPSALELEILDNGVGAPARLNGSGHGLVGMRERIALYGGTFEAGGRDGHGFAVRAQLPLTAESVA
jgi:signal transduction histidine kinase